MTEKQKTKKKIIVPVDFNQEQFTEDLLWCLRKHKVDMMVYAVVTPTHQICPAVIAGNIPDEVKPKLISEVAEALTETLHSWREEGADNDDSNLDDEVLT